MGCFIGDEGDFNPTESDNPKGYWERRDVWALNEAMLDALDASWCRVADLDLQRLDAEQRAEFAGSAREIVARLEPHRPWVIKDPRLCLLFPAWRPALDAPTCLLAYRRPVEVARSLQVRNGFPLAVGIALWEHHVLASLRYSVGLPRLLVTHAELIAEPLETVDRLQRELAGLGVEGLQCPEPAALDRFIDPKLYRARGETAEELELLNPAQLRLARALQDGSALELQSVPQTSDGALDLLRGYFALDRERERLGRQCEKETRTSGQAREELEQARGDLDRTREESERRRAELEQARHESEQRRVELEQARHGSEQRRVELEQVRHESERRRVELEQVRHESERRREELARQMHRVHEIEARLDEAGRRAETAQAELERSRGTAEALETELNESRQAVESVQLRLEQAWHRSGELERDLDGARFARNGMEHQLAETRREIGEAIERADQLQALIELVLGSRRWRFAHQAGELAGRLTLRPRQPAATEHARRLIGEYREWRVRANRRLGLPEE